jgi:hypothetical protein
MCVWKYSNNRSLVMPRYEASLVLHPEILRFAQNDRTPIIGYFQTETL